MLNLWCACMYPQTHTQRHAQVYISATMCTPWREARSQRTTLSAVLHLPPCLRRGLLLLAAATARLAGPQASGDALLSASHLPTGVTGMCYCAQFCEGSGTLNSSCFFSQLSIHRAVSLTLHTVAFQIFNGSHESCLFFSGFSLPSPFV